MSNQSQARLIALCLAVSGLLALACANRAGAHANSIAQLSSRQWVTASGPTTLLPGTTTVRHSQVWRADDGKPVKRADVVVTVEHLSKILYEAGIDVPGRLRTTCRAV